MKFAIAIFLVASVRAQSPTRLEQETARARQLLQSPTWADQAWGAYFAGRLHSEDLKEPLIEEFRSAAALRDAPLYSEQFAYLAALFDAAIQGDIAVPAKLLDPFDEAWTDPVLILLARAKGADGEESLLHFAGDKWRSGVWLAANNLLFARESQRWYTMMLGELPVTHRFIETDPGDVAGIGAGEGGAVCGDGAAAMPKGFPPMALYELQQSPQRGSVLLAQGPEPAYYGRTIVPADKQVGFGHCDLLLDRAGVQIGYLAELANLTAAQAQSLFRAETSIPYRSLEDFQSQVDLSLQTQEQGIREVLRKAKQRGFDPSGVTLQIVPEVIDRRTSATGPVPTLPPRAIPLD